MSCSERTGVRGRTARALLAGAVLALAATTTACGTGSGAEAAAGTGAAPAGTAADPVTRQLAEVEFVRQCTIASLSFGPRAQPRVRGL